MSDRSVCNPYSHMSIEPVSSWDTGFIISFSNIQYEYSTLCLLYDIFNYQIASEVVNHEELEL